MGKTDPFKLMTLIFGVLLLASLVTLYFVVTSSYSAVMSTSTSPNRNATSNSVTGNFLGNSSFLVLSNTSENRSLLGLRSTVSGNDTNVSVGQIVLLPERCFSPQYPDASLSVPEAINFTSNNYLVYANATQDTFIQVPAKSSGSSLMLRSQNFTSLSGLQVQSSARMFFCNPSGINDTITYTIAAYR